MPRQGLARRPDRQRLFDDLVGMIDTPWTFGGQIASIGGADDGARAWRLLSRPGRP
jgi:hypothetical protein